MNRNLIKLSLTWIKNSNYPPNIYESKVQLMHLHYSSSTAKSRLWQFAVAFKCLLIGFLGETSEIICSYCCLSIWKRLEGHFQSIMSKSLYSEKDYSGISPHLVWTEHAKTLLKVRPCKAHGGCKVQDLSARLPRFYCARSSEQVI